MATRSSIEKLPADLRRMIADLREEGRTIDEIKARLVDLSHPRSRSAVGRYVKKLDKVGLRLRNSRAVADALVKRFGDAPESKTARLNIELMHSILMDLMMKSEEAGEDGETDISLSARDAMALAKALDHLGKAEKANADVVRAARAEALEKAAKAVETAMKEKKEISQAEILARIRSVYGVPA